MKFLKDKLVHVGPSENPLVAQVLGGFPRSQDGKALRSFVLTIFGWQLLFLTGQRESDLCCWFQVKTL